MKLKKHLILVVLCVFVISLAACSTETATELPDNIRIRLSESNEGHWGDNAAGFIDAGEFERVHRPRVVVIDTGNNIEDDDRIVTGYNAMDSSSDVSDTDGHGTLVITELLRLVEYVEVIPVKISESDEIFLNYLLRGLEKSISLQPDIINMSIGTATDHPEIAHLIAQAIEQNIVVIAAAGSLGGDELLFPARYDGVISVLARSINNLDIDSNNKCETNRSFSAPGVNVLVGDEQITGSSIAVAYVTAIVSQMIAVAGSEQLSIAEIEHILITTSLHPTRFSHGLVQYNRALERTANRERV